MKSRLAGFRARSLRADRFRVRARSLRADRFRAQRGTRLHRRLLLGLSAGVALALTGVSGTTALWTGSVTLQGGTLTGGSVTAQVAASTRLNHTYTSAAIAKTTYVDLRNAGSVGAQYSLSFSTTSTGAMKDSITLSHWIAASSAACTESAAVAAGGWTGRFGSAPVSTGSLPANTTRVLCVRTRLDTTALATSGTFAPRVNLTLTAPGTQWTSSASATGSQSVTANGALGNDYFDAVLSDGASHYWRLGEATGPVVYDWVGVNDAYGGTGLTRGSAGAIGVSSDAATTFSGTPEGGAGTRIAAAGPQRFAVEAWFKTTTTTGGKIVGYGNQSTGLSGSYDRHIYMDATGVVHFGVWIGSASTISSDSGYNDGQWHHVVGNLGPTGQSFYLDGELVGTEPTTTAQSFSGYWRIGGDNSWGGDDYFDGVIDDVAVYGAPLTARQIANHHNISGQGAFPAGVGDPSGAAVYSGSPLLYWRLGETSGASTAADSSGSGNTGTYSGSVTKPITGALPGTRDTAAAFNGTSGLVSSTTLTAGPQTFTTELWFNTTTATGGKLIGFGNAQTGSSTSYDRHVYLQNDGRLVFGVYNAGYYTAASPLAYNDGKWHHVIATLDGQIGLRLYVDGEIVAYNTDTKLAQSYSGYWRVGGDNIGSWPGAPTTPYVTAKVDDVAVYGTALTETQVKERYAAATGAPIAAFTATANQLTVSFDASDSYDVDGTIASYSWDFGDGTTGTGKTTSRTYTASSVYIVTLTVTDNSGAISKSKWYQAAYDSIAPSTPTGLAVTNRTTTSIRLSWTAATDNVGVTGYQLRRSDGATYTTTTTTYTNTGLTSGTAYSYQVRARDAAGNWSPYTALLATSTTAPTFASTTWYTVRSVASNLCVQAGGTANGSALTQAACTSGSWSQNFRFIAVGSNWRVEYRNATPMVWDVSGVSTAPSAPVHLWTYGGATNQQWQPIQHGNGSYSFKAANSGLCLQFAGGSVTAGVSLEQATCNTGSNTQRFTLAAAP
ncbi:LamG-like jellyroll fold domain-containing protein [Lysobacter korlensis]|uniref:LamG-like jellyroll fold domain-containing protein n=1 Tax=Lysobacter korlensis TaxID=553636 RepID=A0ABV6RZ93_9GAMM